MITCSTTFAQNRQVGREFLSYVYFDQVYTSDNKVASLMRWILRRHKIIHVGLLAKRQLMFLYKQITFYLLQCTHWFSDDKHIKTTESESSCCLLWNSFSMLVSLVLIRWPLMEKTCTKHEMCHIWTGINKTCFADKCKFFIKHVF